MAWCLLREVCPQTTAIIVYVSPHKRPVKQKSTPLNLKFLNWNTEPNSAILLPKPVWLAPRQRHARTTTNRFAHRFFDNAHSGFSANVSTMPLAANHLVPQCCDLDSRQTRQTRFHPLHPHREGNTARVSPAHFSATEHPQHQSACALKITGCLAR